MLRKGSKKPLIPSLGDEEDFSVPTLPWQITHCNWFNFKKFYILTQFNIDLLFGVFIRPSISLTHSGNCIEKHFFNLIFIATGT